MVRITITSIKGGYHAVVEDVVPPPLVNPSQPVEVLSHAEAYGATPRRIAAMVRDLIVSALEPDKSE